MSRLRWRRDVSPRLWKVVLSPFWLLAWCLSRSAKKQRAEEARLEEERLKQYYPVEPPLREMELPSQSLEVKISNFQQQSQLLVRLSPDLRLMIWEHVLGFDCDSAVLHMDLADGIVKYKQCHQPEETPGGPLHFCWNDDWFVEGYKHLPDFRRRRLLSLPLTCKLIYCESIQVMYQCNIFSFRRLEAVARLPKIMVPSHFQNLRKIQLSPCIICTDCRPAYLDFLKDLDRLLGYPGTKADLPELDWEQWWPACCDALASLDHLSDLFLAINFYCPNIMNFRHTWEQEIVMAFLQPLEAVRARNMTVLVIANTSTGWQTSLQPYWFKVRRFSSLASYDEAAKRLTQ